MSKAKIKTIIAVIMQQIIAAGIMVAVAGLLLNSYIQVDSIDGMKTYKVFPAESELEFEETKVYYDLFSSTVSDILQLVDIKTQFETNGSFDPYKLTDITKYSKRDGTDKGCSISAVYELEDLIRWGKYGIDYVPRTMSRTEFINEFGYCIYPENFTFDAYDQLQFDDFYRMGRDTLATGEYAMDAEGNPVGEPAYYGKSVEEVQRIKDEMYASYTFPQLEDMILAYIMSQNLDNIEVSNEDDKLTITFNKVYNRYSTQDKVIEIKYLAKNWIDYLKLQQNLIHTIESVSLNYERYILCNNAYREDKSNVKYLVRLMTENGLNTYTNMSGMDELYDEDITEIFCENRSYMIYYPDSLVFLGNTVLDEEDIYKMVGRYNYEYPDTTHIWLSVDSAYTIKGDAFYNANAIYERVVPKIGLIIGTIVALSVLWILLGIYLTVVTVKAGLHERKWQKLNRFDRVWTEVLLLIAGLFFLGGYYGSRKLIAIAEEAGVTTINHLDIDISRLLQYGIFALYGIYLSLAISIVWYSLIRRAKSQNLWKDSLLYIITNTLKRFVNFILHNKNSVISIMLPYNFFLFVNLVGMLLVYKTLDMTLICVACAIITVVFDGFVGVLMFRNNAERNEIVDGIRHIREGEVEYIIETDNLHGSAKELADAVNNIGDGIRKAVKTSMKDEQMKTDLITNVSHDIKTPLTSIINYIDLLKRLKIEEEPAKNYIEILDGKAKRLKQLTDDLVEASKISSGNIVLNQEKLNLTELLNQGIGEFSEKFEASGLTVVFEKSSEDSFIYADSRRMWRIVENLLNNVCKYALTGTRVYIDISSEDGKVEASIKNISKQQMNIKPDELTERFIRGDSARSTEGSGLGLSIAKSLVQIQGGEFILYLDGDLFKATISFPEFTDKPNVK